MKASERDPGVGTGRAWNISFFLWFYACLCHIELQCCVRNQGNYWTERKICENDRLRWFGDWWRTRREIIRVVGSSTGACCLLGCLWRFEDVWWRIWKGETHENTPRILILSVWILFDKVFKSASSFASNRTTKAIKIVKRIHQNFQKSSQGIETLDHLFILYLALLTQIFTLKFLLQSPCTKEIDDQQGTKGNSFHLSC